MNALIPLLINFKYLLLFPVAAIEGPFVSLIVGFLVKLGYLSFVPSFIIMIFGDIIPDSIYFYLGRFGNRKGLIDKYKLKYAFINRNHEFLERLWIRHGRKTMFLGKLAYGFSIPVIISAGIIDMPYKKFLSYTIPPTLFQYGLLMMVGFYLGSSFTLATKYIKGGGIIVGVIFVLFILGYIFFLKYSKKEIVKIMEDNN